MGVAVGPFATTASVAVDVGFVITSGVFVAVVPCSGVTPGAGVAVLAAGAPGEVVRRATAVSVVKACTVAISIDPLTGVANTLCETGVKVAAGGVE